MIDILAWAPDRQTMINALTSTSFPDIDAIPEKYKGKYVETVNEETGEVTSTYEPKFLASVDEESGKLVMLPGISISEIGPVTKVQGTYDEEGNELTPPVIVDGHHVNFRVGAELSYILTQGLPQSDEEGNPLTIWERTRILQLIPELTSTTLTEIGEDGQTGYVGLSGMKLFDPSVVTKQARRWL